MKKTLLALAVLAASSSFANAAEIYNKDGGSVDFYGQLRTELTFADADDYNGDLSTGSSRIGVDAKYQATDGLAVLGLVELGVASKGDYDEVVVRRHLIGFATDFGTLQFGDDWTTSDDLGGTDYSYFFGGSGNLYGQINDAKSNSQLKYSLDLDNWFVKASYGLNDSSNHQDLAEAFVGAAFGDFSFHVGGGYNRNHDFNTMDLSNTYYEVTGILDATDALQLSATYYGSQLESNATNGNKVDQNAISVGAYWTFMEKTSLYGGYEFVKQEADQMILGDTSSDGTNIFGGVEYKFSSWARVFAEVGYSDGTTLGFTNVNGEQVKAQKVDGETDFGLGARFYW